MPNDRQTSIQDLKDKVKHFCDERDWDSYHNAKDLAIGIITEASELLVLFRFKNDEEVKKLFRDRRARTQICDELSDILHTVLRFAQRFNIDLTTELSRKMAKNEKKHPAPARRAGKNKRHD